MSEEKNTPPTSTKYVVHHAVNSAIGDYAKVENYYTAQAAHADPALAALRELFLEVNKRLEALPAEDKEMLAPSVAQTAKVAAEIQAGDESEEKQTFLAKRLKAIYAMSRDIGEVLMTTLANPSAGIALVIQKIAGRALAETKDAPASA